MSKRKNTSIHKGAEIRKHNLRNLRAQSKPEIIFYLQGNKYLHTGGKKKYHLGQQMRRFSCNVSQKKGGFPVQIGVLVQKERERKKKATEVSGGFMCLKYKVDKARMISIINFLSFP